MLCTLAWWAEIQGDVSQAEKWYRESLRIASEIKVENLMAVSQEALGDFLFRRYSQKYEEGNGLLIRAVETDRHMGRSGEAECVENRRVGKYKDRDKDRIVHTLIYDLDEVPNRQSFAVPTERRSARRPS